MDSGSAVPTLSAGLSATVAEKLFTVASGRDGMISRPAARSTGAGAASAVALDEAASMLLETARLLAADNAGRSRAARTEMMTMTTSSSRRVNAPRRLVPRAARRPDRVGDDSSGNFRMGLLFIGRRSFENH